MLPLALTFAHPTLCGSTRACLRSLVEQEGIVFLDEIDKICSRGEFRGSADASSEGVQRDLLPLIEGSSVQTKHGNINTDHILFIASGAFHHVKPSDLLAELQGRLPIRVELKPLTEEDFYTILTEPVNNLCKQQEALMETEGVQLVLEDCAKWQIAKLATEINRDVENIGARRLHTVRHSCSRLRRPAWVAAPPRACLLACATAPRLLTPRSMDRTHVTQLT